MIITSKILRHTKKRFAVDNSDTRVGRKSAVSQGLAELAVVGTDTAGSRSSGLVLRDLFDPFDARFRRKNVSRRDRAVGEIVRRARFLREECRYFVESDESGVCKRRR